MQYMTTDIGDMIFVRLCGALVIAGVIGVVLVDMLDGIPIPPLVNTVYLSVLISVFVGGITQYEFDHINRLVGSVVGALVSISAFVFGWGWGIGGWPYWVAVGIVGIGALVAINVVVVIGGRLLWRQRDDAIRSSEKNQRTKQERYIARQMERRNRERGRR